MEGFEMSNELVRFDCTKCFQRETTLSNSTLTFSIVASWNRVTIDFPKDSCPVETEKGLYKDISPGLIQQVNPNFNKMVWPNTSLNTPKGMHFDTALEKKIFRIFDSKSYESGYSEELTKKFNKFGFEVVADVYMIFAKESHQKLEITNGN